MMDFDVEEEFKTCYYFNHFPLFEPVIAPSQKVYNSIITIRGSPYSLVLVLTKSIGSYPLPKQFCPLLYLRDLEYAESFDCK